MLIDLRIGMDWENNTGIKALSWNGQEQAGIDIIFCFLFDYALKSQDETERSTDSQDFPCQRIALCKYY